MAQSPQRMHATSRADARFCRSANDAANTQFVAFVRPMASVAIARPVMLPPAMRRCGVPRYPPANSMISCSGVPMRAMTLHGVAMAPPVTVTTRLTHGSPVRAHCAMAAAVATFWHDDAHRGRQLARRHFQPRYRRDQLPLGAAWIDGRHDDEVPADVSMSRADVSLPCASAARRAAMASGLSSSMAMEHCCACNARMSSRAPCTTSSACSRSNASSQQIHGSHSAPFKIRCAAWCSRAASNLVAVGNAAPPRPAMPASRMASINASGSSNVAAPGGRVCAVACGRAVILDDDAEVPATVGSGFQALDRAHVPGNRCVQRRGVSLWIARNDGPDANSGRLPPRPVSLKIRIPGRATRQATAGSGTARKADVSACCLWASRISPAGNAARRWHVRPRDAGVAAAMPGPVAIRCSRPGTAAGTTRNRCTRHESPCAGSAARRRSHRRGRRAGTARNRCSAPRRSTRRAPPS